MLNKHFHKRPLQQPVKDELKKWLNDNKSLNQDLIINEMGFLNNDIENTIHTIRNIYINDNSFKVCINILTIFTYHYQIYSKLGKNNKSRSTRNVKRKLLHATR